MIKTIVTAAAVAAAALTCATLAQAEDFPAAPMNHGPMVMSGMGPLGELGNIALLPANVIAQPIDQIGQPAPAPAEEPMVTHHHHHHHHMMKKM